MVCTRWCTFKSSDKCTFGAITPDDLLRDRIIFGIADNKVRERLLHEPELNLSKMLDICRALEMSQAQIKTVSEFNSSNIHLLQENKKASEGNLSGGQPSPTNQLCYPCCFCGRKHASKCEAWWVWSETQEKARSDNKTVISQAPVLCFYSLRYEVTLQCDASDTGLRAALLQLQQPVSFASRALTQTDTRYAQIEELLAIVFACEKFDEYLFGRDVVHV